MHFSTKTHCKINKTLYLSQKLKSESGILRKKFSSLQKEMEDQKEGVRKQQAEVTKLNAVIRDMEKDIIVLKKEIQERDDTIQDKVCHFFSVQFVRSSSTVVHLSVHSTLIIHRNVIILLLATCGMLLCTICSSK